MASPASDVLVVGSGPAGLVCALSLAQNGVRVRIIDKLTVPPVGQRGSGISPRTLELYKFLGVLEDIKKRGREARGVQPYGTDGKPLPPRRVMPRRDPTPGVPEPNFWTVGQDDACAVLREHLKTYDVSVEFGTELVGFEQDETGVTVSLEYTEDGKEESARVKFLVGADGGRSSVRKLAGIQFIGESSPEYTRITGEVELTGLSGDFMHIFNSVDKAMIMTREVYQKPPQFYVYISGCDTTRALEDVEYLQQHFAQVTQNPGIKVHKIIQLREWRLNVRMAERFRDGRVFLAGDAGHVHSPTGGQGMNSGLQDSMNLAWKLALVCKNLASISLLQTYDEERQPVIREMLRISVGIFNRNQEPQRRGDEQQNAPGALRQLGVNYRWSSIVVDELQIDDPDLSSALEPINSYGSDEPDRLHAGDRAPDATSLVKIKDESRTTLFGLFRSTRHAVLVFDLALADSIYSITAKWGDIVSVIVIQQPDAARDTRDEVFVDMEGRAARAYFVEAGVRAVVVRPDGVVGALARTSDVVAKYFSKVLL